ncbi:ABC transporter permease subunit [Neobacillus mesonae]|uniref:ABC transporter permease subunit n=1 Tax=Neobacillus mesonae TaxID=1193713 RepID=UPI0025728AEF|nr:ABC transporter permease subunit [Neobacillus mesonae]
MNRLFSINYSLYAGILLSAILIFLAIFGPILAPHTLTETLKLRYENGTIFAPPLGPFKSNEFLLGTDQSGYDLLSMILYGIRYTIIISFTVTLFKMTAGTLIGLYVGTWKKTPQWLEAFENAWSYVPLFLIMFFFLRPITFNVMLDPNVLVFYFIIIASIVSTPSIVSSVRKKSREISTATFIEAAWTLGANRHRLVWKHIFPQLKESLLVMFILEIVQVIALMGQLALMKIFIGGTIYRPDNQIYLSITKEISGLVGAARESIYSNSIYILYVPLILLLIITISFSLLANGLKNRFQSNYQRTPWIKTGFEPSLRPKRKVYKKKRSFYLTGESLAFVVLILTFVGFGTYVYITKDNDIGVKNYSRAAYYLNLKMGHEGKFTTNAKITVTNESDNKWEDLVFYFIPNAFTKGHSIKSVKGFSVVDIKEIKVNGEKADFSLNHDTLRILLNKKMESREQAKVEIIYQFTVPEEGSRFSKVKDHYYLAQWYPMLATFQNGKWNKEDYQDGFETFHTDFSNYVVHYEIPKEYSFISTADKDPGLNEHKGQVKVKKVRDFFIAVVKDFKMYTTAVNGVEVRLFTKEDHDKAPKDTLKLAKKALDFYQKNIGEYPLSQLDVILDNGQNMEYPGIITVDPYHANSQFFKIALVHEIAHQYFYGVVSNDQYHEAWLDEGFTEFATNMYFYLAEHQGPYQAQAFSMYRMRKIEELGLGSQISNVPLSEHPNAGYIYGQPALKLFELINHKHDVRREDLNTSIVNYLAAYYNRFKYKEVNTPEFIRFTMDYYQVPEEYFNDWLSIRE